MHIHVHIFYSNDCTCMVSLRIIRSLTLFFWSELFHTHDKLTKEQPVLDDHEDNVEDLMEYSEDLVRTTYPAIPHTSDMCDH